MMLRYTEAFPEDLDLAWARRAPAIVPWGALEWHGNHLPLGTDSLLAETFAEELAVRMDGVLLPVMTCPVTPLPHRHSLGTPTLAFRGVVDGLLAGLAASGARTVALVSGHYAQGHEIELYEAALRAHEDHGLDVLAASPLEVLERDELLDHAGRWETAQMLRIRPDLVRTKDCGDPNLPGESAVLGEDPARASRAEADKIVTAALSRWQELLSAQPAARASFYRRRFDALEGYVDRYGDEGWETGIERWWRDRTGRPEMRD